MGATAVLVLVLVLPPLLLVLLLPPLWWLLVVVVVDASCRFKMVVLVVLVMVEGRGGRGGHVWSRCVSKKTHYGPKRRMTHRLGPFSPSPPFLSRISYIYNLIYKLNISRYQKNMEKEKKRLT